MSAYAIEPIEIESHAARAESDSGLYLPVLEVAATLGVQPTTFRRMIWSGKVDSREGERGDEVNVATLPAKYRGAYAARIAPQPVTALRLADPEERAPRYKGAHARGKERAEFRYEAVLSFEKARAAKRPGETLAAVEHRWLHNFRRGHHGKDVSLRSVKSWADMLRRGNGSIDALVDGNDGVKQRGDRIPPPAKRMFRDEYLRDHRPNIALIYSNVVAVAKVKGWGEMPSYDTFWRYATKRLPKLVRRLLRENADTPRAVLPHVRRDPATIGAYHTIQSDHREIDVPVRCDNGCSVCTGKKPKGLFRFGRRSSTSAHVGFSVAKSRSKRRRAVSSSAFSGASSMKTACRGGSTSTTAPTSERHSASACASKDRRNGTDRPRSGCRRASPCAAFRCSRLACSPETGPSDCGW